MMDRITVVVDTREQEPYSFDSDKVSAVRKALPRAIYKCDECGVPRELTVAHAERHLGLGKRILCKACLTRLHQQSMATAAQFGASGQWAHTRKETISINGCTLVAARGGRCKQQGLCSGYSECLAAVVEKGWLGWKTVTA